MKLPLNRFKQVLQAGELQVGFWSQLASPMAVEVLADAGYDFVVVDAEHAPNDVTTVMPMLQILDRSSASAVVRLPWSDMVLVKRYLDVGTQTLLVPFIETPEQAAELVAFTRYPPDGVRGVANCHRANRYGRVSDYFAAAADGICVLVQIETERGLENLEAIAAIDGIDGLFVGPSDLAASMGQLGDPAHPTVQSAIADVPRRLRSSGKPAGILAGVESVARRHMEAGFTFVAVGSDLAILSSQVTALAGGFDRRPRED
jgi:2-keto-3-deoxy-L-rhamnonate aldolase RhmA